jgi:hypothetical protein
MPVLSAKAPFPPNPVSFIMMAFVIIFIKKRNQ